MTTKHRKTTKVAAFIAALAAGALALGACAEASAPEGDTSLPSTRVEVVTNWTNTPVTIDGYDFDRYRRVVSIEESCFVETIDPYDGQEISMTEIACPLG
jgi:hypothetical protein